MMLVVMGSNPGLRKLHPGYPADLARELGIRQNQLYKWREEIKRKGDAAFKASSPDEVQRNPGESLKTSC